MRIISFDLETEWAKKIDGVIVERPAFVVLGWADAYVGQVHFIYDVAEARRQVQGWLEARDVLLVGHNMAYDLWVLNLMPSRDCQLWDTMVAQILIERAEHDSSRIRPRSLKALTGRDEDEEKVIQASFVPGQELSERQAKYLEKDVLGPLTLLRRAQRAGYFEQFRRLMPLQIRAMVALNEVMYRGLPVDEDEVRRLLQALEQEKREQAKKLEQAHFYTPPRKKKRGEGEIAEKVHMKDLARLAAQVQAEAGYEPKRTDKGSPALDKEVRQRVYGRHEILTAYYDFQDYRKIITELRKCLHCGGLIRPRYYALLATGRCSTSNPNIHSWPSRGRFADTRRIFVAPAGHVYYEIDYNQIELCCLAELTGGQLWKLINSGQDIHRKMAAFYFRKPEEEVTKKERQLMKILNFGAPGGMGPDTLREQIVVAGFPDPGRDGAADLLNAWRQFFPELARFVTHDPAELKLPRPQWKAYWAGFRHVDTDPVDEADWEAAWEYARERAEENGAPATILELIDERIGDPAVERWVCGRRLVIKGGWVRYPVSRTEYNNGQFQGLAAMLTKDALGRLAELPDIQVRAFVHDAFLLAIPEDARRDERALQAAQVMIEAAHTWLPTTRVTVDICGPGKNWYEAKQKVFKEKYGGA